MLVFLLDLRLYRKSFPSLKLWNLRDYPCSQGSWILLAIARFTHLFWEPYVLFKHFRLQLALQQIQYPWGCILCLKFCWVLCLFALVSWQLIFCPQRQKFNKIVNHLDIISFFQYSSGLIPRQTLLWCPQFRFLHPESFYKSKCWNLGTGKTIP